MYDAWTAGPRDLFVVGVEEGFHLVVLGQGKDLGTEGTRGHVMEKSQHILVSIHTSIYVIVMVFFGWLGADGLGGMRMRFKWIGAEASDTQSMGIVNLENRRAMRVLGGKEVRQG